MCTCITYKNGDFYFGRNLDLEYSFGEQVAVTPRNYPFVWKKQGESQRHYAMIGMATVAGGYPLYAEAVNEKGLCMAGLNFPGNACYRPYREGMKNVASWELIPWILGQCRDLDQAEDLIRDLNVLEDAFSPQMPPAPLHWMLADRQRCLVLEAVEEGLKVYENPAGVLTNNPPFAFHQTNLGNYLNLTPRFPENRFAMGLKLKPYGQGMGALGLPGDSSPASRFIRAAFLRWNSVSPQDENSNISQFFHILDSVAMVRGSVATPEGRCDITTYSCCVNGDKGVYYYKTYENNQIRAVNLYGEDLEQEEVKAYPLEDRQQICYVN